MLAAAKYIGAGVACSGLTGAGARQGGIFGSLILTTKFKRNPFKWWWVFVILVLIFVSWYFIPSENLIVILKALKTANELYSLNSLWLKLGLTQWKFLLCFNLFFIFMFIFLNIYLIYLENLDLKIKNEQKPVSHMQSGVGGGNTAKVLKKLAGYFIVTLGVASSIITVDSWREKGNQIAEYQREAQKQKEEVNVSEYQRYSDNYHNRTNIAQIARNHKQCTLLNQQIEDKSFLIKTLEAKLEAEKPFADYEVRLNDEQKRMAAISERDSIIRQLLRENKELDSSIRTGLKFAQAFYETDDTKALEVVNDVEIKKSMMFNISLEEMWNTFEYLDGITKLAISLIFNSSLIMWYTFSIVVSLYGNYLLTTFKLEKHYPNIAPFVQYSQKVSKYYIITNFCLIILICLTNILFGLVILNL